MYNPISTYRLQLHKNFNFKDFKKIIEYLSEIGVRTVYASPIFESTPGSTHGYDGLNPHRVNPEIGNDVELRQLSNELKQKGIGWLQDIVPNHMAFDMRNEWLFDVLEKGRKSRYAHFFDIFWTNGVDEQKPIVPFLGSTLQEVIGAGELQLVYEHSKLTLRYFDAGYPLNLHSYITVMEDARFPNKDLSHLRSRIDSMESIEDPAVYHTEWNSIFQHINRSLASINLEDLLNGINNNNEKLTLIAEKQNYRLVHWQETDARINYRRFFTVNGLICLNMQLPGVFSYFHTYIKSLIDANVFQGLRIDHIDGLYEPAEYLRQLRNLAGESSYIIVEKILAPAEYLPNDWPVEGNTGYDFLAMVNNLFTRKSSRQKFAEFYSQLTGDVSPIDVQVKEKKAYILYRHMTGELDYLFRIFLQLLVDDDYRHMRTEDIRTAIAEFLIHCPVYRFYGSSFPFPDEERRHIQAVLVAARNSRPELSAPFELLTKVLLPDTVRTPVTHHQKILHFFKRCMQFSGPLMAKGVEDTLMYSYNYFIAHNEVGDAPESFGHSIDEFHVLMKLRQKQSPISLNATSTHDTKRGEDVRARLNILSELPEEWIQKVNEWRRVNADLVLNAPDANDEYFLYQTLVGTFPVEGFEVQDYPERLSEYLRKAMREAKRHSNWTNPDEAYEEGFSIFALQLLKQDTPFWKTFYPFLQEVADLAITNSLAQVILKFTCPGVPDIYQGTELWDLSLVDPDNRRPVDYPARMRLLDQLKTGDHQLLKKLWQQRGNGNIKLWLTQFLLKLRSGEKELFTEGAYLPLKVKGRFKDHIFAFARVYRSKAVIVVLPIQVAELSRSQKVNVVDIEWKDTHVILPSRMSTEIENKLSSVIHGSSTKLTIKNIFTEVPFAILQTTLREHKRSAGLLLHITSLPSLYGIGDLGPGARAFAEFLHRSGQRYWQVLPVNPTESGQGNSPYSSLSSRAGNTLLISPDVLKEQGWLTEADLLTHQIGNNSRIDYLQVENTKKELLMIAWQNKLQSGKIQDESFEAFCNEERYWLNDYALYVLLKQINDGKPWYEWPAEFKFRDQKALVKLNKENMQQLDAIKWFQFIFYEQWRDLKKFCNDQGIQLIGDLPIYISYDSSDVWSNREIFSLDEQGNRVGVAGVPPDAFSDEGQLWGMPVFKWDVLKTSAYGWWIERLKSNRRLFDLIRLDHFRGFSDYWEVNASETTAKYGEWKAGPGSDFLRAVREALGELPFVAEDLGDIDEPVLQLRDEFNLPGMKVLQFGFGDDVGESEHIPHNYEQNFIVYTGTHDNNTTRGWFRTETSPDTRERINEYFGKVVAETEIADSLCKLAMSSVAKTAIIPTQDLLGLDESARMNIPSVGENNWTWRLLPNQLTYEAEQKLLGWTVMYNRK